MDACLKADIPLLGICLGAQMIAFHLGASVGPIAGQPHEFGYYPVYPEPSAEDFMPAGWGSPKLISTCLEFPRARNDSLTARSSPTKPFAGATKFMVSSFTPR
ncbi:hypothetical protein [Mesorhizobium sp. WSM3868]|uniref:glutamine amidotransferase-related protein n=1 Tax=Mesorhizobium sp. WSM3868 TaxID=2029405 RepID=UPI001FDF4234|nr:hypothetical protein [Mesorhizobium sp. WSM3868]